MKAGIRGGILALSLVACGSSTEFYYPACSTGDAGAIARDAKAPTARDASRDVAADSPTEDAAPVDASPEAGAHVAFGEACDASDGANECERIVEGRGICPQQHTPLLPRDMFHRCTFTCADLADAALCNGTFNGTCKLNELCVPVT